MEYEGTERTFQSTLSVLRIFGNNMMGGSLKVSCEGNNKTENYKDAENSIK
jgi:hypothetical protein